jgi:UDP-GlcNAc3NAcA epimerase
MKILTVVGARPQFVKVAAVSRILRRQHTEVLVHTGQHYDHEMSALFFEELGIPRPDFELGVGSGGHGWQTGQMLIQLEEVLQKERPDWTLVYGDTNSTLAGALAAAKLGMRVAHVESGLRSFNRSMPEEHNRVLTDHCSDILFCPTQSAAEQLGREGVTRGVHVVGDVMYDAALQFAAVAREKSDVLERLELQPAGYALATLHRPYNVDDPARLSEVLASLKQLEMPVVFPVHPRTRARLSGQETGRLKLIDPVGYLDMLMLEQNAALILTDSGGVQKEAYFFATPCITVRPETEWIETVEAGWNRLAWGGPEAVLEAARHPWPSKLPPPVFGDGHASEKIAAVLAVSQAA